MPPCRSSPSAIPLFGNTRFNHGGNVWQTAGYEGRNDTAEKMTTNASNVNRPPTFFMGISCSLLLFRLTPQPCNVVPLDLDLRVIGDLQRHRILSHVGHGSPDAGRGDDFVSFFQRLQHALLLLLFLLLG